MILSKTHISIGIGMVVSCLLQKSTTGLSNIFTLPTLRTRKFHAAISLEKLHLHENDSKIRFFEEDHSYTFDGHRMKWSVTSLIHGYFSQFDPEAAVRMMMSGKRWPRAEYCHPSGKPFSAEEVTQAWSTLSKNARHNGMIMHQNIERIFHGLEPLQAMPERPQFEDFRRSVMDVERIVPFRTEWRVAAPDLSIAGSIDFVGKTSCGKFVIIDWKRSYKLSSSNGNSCSRVAKPPLTHIPDCDLSKYMLQLNFYQFILQHYYGIECRKMLLVSFHPSLKNFFMYEVPRLHNEIDLIIRDAKKCSSHP